MSHAALRRFGLAIAAFAVLVTTSSCGGGGGGGGGAAPPVITSFVASAPYVAAGDAADLTATFTGVDAFIVPGSTSVVQQLAHRAGSTRKREQLRGQLAAPGELTILEHEPQQSMRPLERQRRHLEQSDEMSRRRGVDDDSIV